jgi:hypothetical protein
MIEYDAILVIALTKPHYMPACLDSLSLASFLHRLTCNFLLPPVSN